MGDKQAYAGLLERLLLSTPQPFYSGGYKFERAVFINPDGPEAAEAISSLLKRVGELEGVRDAVLWELPRTHKGFHCQYDHDTIARAFVRASKKLAAGERAKSCRCQACAALNSDAPLSIGEGL